MKILKKVRLINWHRFQDETIEFAESVLLSGENGAGKSTILDAVQFVITCSKANFNKAAHEKGKRNLNSYIRCKTGREDRPYERTGALSAHIALEFYDEARKRPFIVGAVMDSATEEKEPNVAWYLIEKKRSATICLRPAGRLRVFPHSVQRIRESLLLPPRPQKQKR